MLYVNISVWGKIYSYGPFVSVRMEWGEETMIGLMYGGGQMPICDLSREQGGGCEQCEPEYTAIKLHGGPKLKPASYFTIDISETQEGELVE